MTTDFFSYFADMYGGIRSFDSLTTHHFGGLGGYMRGEEPDSSFALSLEAESHSCSKIPYPRNRIKI